MPRGGGQRRQGGGRVLLHERNTEDAPTIGSEIILDTAHLASVRNTESNGITDSTRKEHRRRIQHFCDFLAKEYPAYAVVGVRALTQEDHANVTKFWYKCTHDIVYRGLNTDFFKAFLASRSIKPNGNTCSYPHLRKFNDAILYGSEQVNQPLPSKYYIGVNNYLKAFKK